MILKEDSTISSDKHFKIYKIGKIKKIEDNKHKIKIYDKYLDALEKIENYNELRIVYFMDKLNEKDRQILKVHPRNNQNNPLRGIFSTHSPVRPNPLGITVVKLLKRDGNILIVEGLDALDNSPLIDIKSN